jgi:hypothetical protein
MKVNFADEAPQYDGANLLVNFVAQVDGAPVLCSITAEALEDHFGADSALEAAVLRAFEKGRTRIHPVCVKALSASGGAPVVLHSGFFRDGVASDLQGT